MVQSVDPAAHLFALNLLGVLLVICWGGMGPGFLTAVLTSMGTDYFFIEPTGAIFDTPAGIIQLTLYLAITTLAGSIVASLRHFLYVENLSKLSAERASEADRNVLHVVSHDLKTPLSALAMRLTLLEEDLAQKILPEERELFRGVESSLTHITRIIDDLQEAGRIQTGVFSTEFVDFEIDRLVQDAIFAFREHAEAKRIRIQLDLARDLPRVRSDNTRLVQVISNFLSNAIKFAPERSSVQVRVAREGRDMRVSVSNDGEGISESDLPFVFDRHWQAPATRHMGMGLGLYIAKVIVQSLNGKIGVESRNGKGCTFYFSIPTSL